MGAVGKSGVPKKLARDSLFGLAKIVESEDPIVLEAATKPAEAPPTLGMYGDGNALVTRALTSWGRVLGGCCGRPVQRGEVYRVSGSVGVKECEGEDKFCCNVIAPVSR